MRITALPLIVAATVSLAACGAGPEASTSPASSPASSSASPPASSAAASSEPAAGASAQPAGAYLPLADYEKDAAARAGTKIVYFFHAPWCPDCRATEAALTAQGVPAGLTVVKVDYDSATELKARYGITKQHTFVLIDKDGMAKKTFTGTFDGASIKDALA